MPRGYGRKDIVCSGCGRTFLVNNGCRAGAFRCADCPLRCSTCGADVPRRQGGPRQHLRCQRCAALHARQQRGTRRGTFLYARNLAKRRGIGWALSEDEYLSLRTLPCHYCGFGLPPTGMGIDRIDFRLGYHTGNVVPCCAECNIAKNASFTCEEMKLIGRVIALIKRRRREEGRGDHKFGRKRKYAE